MPGLRGDLEVRINDGVNDRVVTRYCRGLKFTKTAPGGHASLSFTLNLPQSMFNDLSPQDRVYVYDARTVRTVWEGYLENPTPVDGPDGQQFDISAVGGMALASDETRALIYVDQTLDGWSEVKYGGAHPDGTAGQYNDPDSSITGLRTQLQRGLVLATNDVAAIDYRAIDRAGMQLAGVRTITQSGKTDANYRAQFYDFIGGGTNIGDTFQMSTTAIDQTQWIGVSIASGATKFLLQLARTGGATTVGDDTTWTNFTGVSVLGRRMDRNGTLLTTAAAHGSTALTVLASQVVEDLLGRLLTMCDADTAQVDVTAYTIDQLAWPDGAKAADVLNALSVYEPDFLWEILETLENGKHRFGYRAWPTAPRYEFTDLDGFQQRGSDLDLCNRILVSWTDSAGNQQVTAVTAASLGLTGKGYPVDQLGNRVKDADPISLPDKLGSSANATRIGGQILTDKVNPPKGGSVVVRRPIWDHLLGGWVMPWELEPGYLGTVRETGDVLRITEADYDDDTCSTVLALGTPVLTTEQRVAALDRAARMMVGTKALR
jgi:hypothetical protein